MVLTIVPIEPPMEDAEMSLSATAEKADAGLERMMCVHCQGNGEIVTDWGRYLQPRAADIGDEAVAECPDCDGVGFVPAA